MDTPLSPRSVTHVLPPEASNLGLDSHLDIDLFDWYPCYQRCQQYFLDHAQRSGPVQALSAFLNIKLPFQQCDPSSTSKSSTPSAPEATGMTSIATTPPPAGMQAAPSSSSPRRATPDSSTSHSDVSLIPYIRRLVATGMDSPGVLQGFFGDDWVVGVGPLHEHERHNYLFAAKSGGWASVKKDYDITPQETVPFLRPLQGSSDSEIETAEDLWSKWLAMEDWMLGPRAPDIS